MMDNPIDQSSLKSNVAACLFAFDPFVAEYFRFLGAKSLVKPRFHEALRQTVRINECHEMPFRREQLNLFNQRSLLAQLPRLVYGVNTPYRPHGAYGKGRAECFPSVLQMRQFRDARPAPRRPKIGLKC